MSDGNQPAMLHYFTGESLNTSDFIAEQNYMLQRFQTNVSSLNIWGIASGLTVVFQNDTVRINPGVAFDFEGRTLVLENDAVIALSEAQKQAIRSDAALSYLVMSYGTTPSDYTRESSVGGFKRTVEMPVFSIQKNLDDHSLVLASFSAKDGSAISIGFHCRRYCSQQLGSLAFASCSDSDGAVSTTLPAISGYYYNDPDKPAGSCLRIDSPALLVSSPMTVIPHKESAASAQTDSDVSTQTLLNVNGSVVIDDDLNVKGTIRNNGEILHGSLWNLQVDTKNIYYNDGSVIVGMKPTGACAEKLSVYGEAKITGNVICNGAGSKFIGNGSGLTNLPNSPWVQGTNTAQSNIYYPGLNSQGGAATGSVGIGSFSSLAGEFPTGVSLIVKDKACVQKLSGTPSVAEQPKATDSDSFDALVITSSVSLQNEIESETNLTIAKGDLDLQLGSLKIESGYLQVNGSVTATSLQVNGGVTATSLQVSGSVTAATYYGDGSNLSGVGYWTQDPTTHAISYKAGPVVVGDSAIPADTNASLYVTGNSMLDSLSVAGKTQISALSVTGTIVPCAGRKDGGIQFPADVGGGSGDTAWIRYYSNKENGEKDEDAGDPCTLEIGIANDAQDNIYLNPSGNVGIGVAYPTAAKLVVAGSIAVVQGGRVNQVVTAPGVTRLVAGVIKADGTIAGGSGFSAVRTGTGAYKVTFTSSYSSLPAVVASPVKFTSSTQAVVLIATIQIGYFEILCSDGTGQATDYAFSFIVTG